MLDGTKLTTDEDDEARRLIGEGLRASAKAQSGGAWWTRTLLARLRQTRHDEEIVMRSLKTGSVGHNE